MEKVLLIITYILELLELGAKYLPEIIKQFRRAVEIANDPGLLTPELEAQIKADEADLNQKLSNARSEREKEATEMGVG